MRGTALPPSAPAGFRAAREYARMSTVVARTTTTGKKTVAADAFRGDGSGLEFAIVAAGAVHTLRAGVASGGIAMGVGAGVHVTRVVSAGNRQPKQSAGK